MQKVNNKMQMILILILFSLSIFSTAPISGDIIPVMPLSNSQHTFKPTVFHNNSLFMIPANSQASNVMYSGKSANILYTNNNGNTFPTTTKALSDGSNLPTASPNSLKSDTLTNANPFIPALSIPRLENITYNDSLLTYYDTIQLNLHLGYSLTFYFNHSITYYAIVQTNQPFFFDVNIINPSSSINFNFTGTRFPNSVQSMTEKNSVPIIPNDNNLQAIEISNTGTSDSLVTLAPLPFDVSNFGTTQVTNGQYFTDKIQQGKCYNVQTDPNYQQTLRLLNLKFFQFPIKSDNIYQIHFYSNDLSKYNSTYLSCPSGNLIAIQTDFTNNFTYEGGSLTSSNGLIIKAKSDGLVNITLIATGLVNKSYGFFFNEANQFPIPKEHSLSFNQPINLLNSPSDYYTFLINQPSVMAINYTGTAASYSWSVFNPLTGNYGSSFSPNLYPESGNLINKSSTDLMQNGGNFNWIYIPAGSYRLDVTGSDTSSKYQFNLIQVQTFTSSITLTMGKNTIQAIQLPLNQVDYNFINISTSEHNNISVTYQWGIMGEYSRPSSYDTVQFSSNSTSSFGNMESNGVWVGYSINKTNLIVISKPARSHYIPIMIIAPSIVKEYYNNNTQYFPTNFTTKIIISSNTLSNYKPSATISNVGTGIQMVVPGTVTDNTQIPVNDNLTASRYRVYAFTLATSANTLYNLTATGFGSYSAGPGHLNGTIISMFVYSDNLYDASVLNNKLTNSTNTTYTYNVLFLAISTTCYLFIEVDRTTSLYNSTLTLYLSSIEVGTLDAQLTTNNFAFNSTVSSYELVDTTPLWSIIGYTYPNHNVDLFVPLMVATGVVIVAGGAGGGLYYMRKKKGTGKFPK